MVGSLYPQGSPKRDGGFTIFYMGVNLGAAMAPLLCGYIGETYGWHRGFGLATIGMLTGIAVFVAPSIISQIAMAVVAIIAALNIFVVPLYVGDDDPMRNYLSLGVLACLDRGRRDRTATAWARTPSEESELSRLLLRLVIMATAIAAAYGLVQYGPDNIYSQSINYFVAISLLIAAVVAWIALGRGGLPANTGAPPDEAGLRKPRRRNTSRVADLPGSARGGPGTGAVRLGLRAVQSRSGTHDHSRIRDQERSRQRSCRRSPRRRAAGNQQAGRTDSVPVRHRRIGLFRVANRQARPCSAPADVCRVHSHVLLDALLGLLRAGRQLGQQFHRPQRESRHRPNTNDHERRCWLHDHHPADARTTWLSNGGRVFTIDQLDALRNANRDNPDFTIEWAVAADNVGMVVADRNQEIPASWFQSINPVYILIFGLAFTALWGFLGKSRSRAEHACKVCSGLAAARPGFRRVLVWSAYRR